MPRSRRRGADLRPRRVEAVPQIGGRLNPEFTFANFVEGKSNQLARAAARAGRREPGRAYNPLFIYGGVGLGKTHLMHAVGNHDPRAQQDARIAYVHSERFVGDMVRALQHNTISEFKNAYRTLDALLIDDIQFFAGKERSQEEFFHTFNALLEGQQQVILTCDRYPKEVAGPRGAAEVALRLGPHGCDRAAGARDLRGDPDEQVRRRRRRAARGGRVLRRQADPLQRPRTRRCDAPRDRELAVHRSADHAGFREGSAASDLLALQERLVTIENIQKTVAEYFKIRVADLLSKRRSRSITRPRQVAMALSKELTNHSLPEIGDAFGGRDHTTVLHACRVIKELRETQTRMNEDYLEPVENADRMMWQSCG